MVIASVQSLIRRLENYQPNAFDLIIIDEAHHAVAKSYLQILQYFKQDVPVVGFSATFEGPTEGAGDCNRRNCLSQRHFGYD